MNVTEQMRLISDINTNEPLEITELDMGRYASDRNMNTVSSAVPK